MVRKISDRSLENKWLEYLREAGFDPEVEPDVLHLRGVGVGHGDRSVDLTVRVLTMDDHRVIELLAPIRSVPASFATATLAAVKGNGSCHLAKFTVEELPTPSDLDQAFRIQAQFHLYADHLSQDEFTVMVSLFLKEVDEIDNELSTIMAMT
jgi:hypothetical protein